MKIILFIDSLAGGGAQRQLVNLAVGLADRNHTVHVSTYFDFDTHLTRLRENKITYQCFEKQGRWDFRPAKKLYQQIHALKPDVVIAFLRTPAFYAELVKIIKPSTKLIVSERCGVEEFGLTFRDYLPAIGHLSATHLTANSFDYLQRLTRKVIPLRKKSSVIYNGVSDTFLKVGAKRVDASATDHVLENSIIETQTLTKFCVVAARTSRQKGLLPLVRAMILLADENMGSFTIDWIGPIDESEDQFIQAKDLLQQHELSDRFRWLGKTDNTEAVYPLYDALLLPSLYEGVANTMCEAMCCALPVIVTDIADNRRILDGNKHGLLCRPDNAESLAEAMRTFVTLSVADRQQLAISAYYRAQSLFSMSKKFYSLVHSSKALMMAQ